MNAKRPKGMIQSHFWVSSDDWTTIKTYCARSGRRIYASDFVRVFLAALAAEMRARMAENTYTSEIDLSRVKPMTIQLMRELEDSPIEPTVTTTSSPETSNES